MLHSDFRNNANICITINYNQQLQGYEVAKILDCFRTRQKIHDAGIICLGGYFAKFLVHMVKGGIIFPQPSTV